MFCTVSRRVLAPVRFAQTCGPRFASTLQSSPHVYVLDHPINPQSKIFSLLSTTPPTVELALGETEVVPPEQDPSAFRENPRFLHILHSVLAEQACQDPQVKAQAAAMISSSGASFMQVNRRTSTGSSGASDQGGYGSAGRGGFIHVSDNRRPPDYGRIADPEDIFGSLEVEGDGSFTNGTGKYQESGTYRIVTRDGVLGLPEYLRQRLVERLKIEEAAVKNK